MCILVFVSAIKCELLSRRILHLFFHPGNRGDVFLRNVSLLSKDYTELYPRKYNSSAIELNCTYRYSLNLFVGGGSEYFVLNRAYRHKLIIHLNRTVVFPTYKIIYNEPYITF
jgi:hypothetical protein